MPLNYPPPISLSLALSAVTLLVTQERAVATGAEIKQSLERLENRNTAKPTGKEVVTRWDVVKFEKVSRFKMFYCPCTKPANNLIVHKWLISNITQMSNI